MKKNISEQKIKTAKNLLVARFAGTEAEYNFKKLSKIQKILLYSILPCVALLTSLYFLSTTAFFMLFLVAGGTYIVSLPQLKWKLEDIIEPYLYNGMTCKDFKKMLRSGEYEALKKEHYIELGEYRERCHIAQQEAEQEALAQRTSKKIDTAKQYDKTQTLKQQESDSSKTETDNNFVWVEEDKSL